MNGPLDLNIFWTKKGFDLNSFGPDVFWTQNLLYSKVWCGGARYYNAKPENMWWSKGTLEFRFCPNLGLRIWSLDQAEQYHIMVRNTWFYFWTKLKFTWRFTKPIQRPMLTLWVRKGGGAQSYICFQFLANNLIG